MLEDLLVGKVKRSESFVEACKYGDVQIPMMTCQKG